MSERSEERGPTEGSEVISRLGTEGSEVISLLGRLGRRADEHGEGTS